MTEPISGRLIQPRGGIADDLARLAASNRSAASASDGAFVPAASVSYGPETTLKRSLISGAGEREVSVAGENS
jgi:hypothetical protein